MFDLLHWLRRAPKPSRLRLKTADDQERYIDLGKSRVRWADVESSVRSSDAVTVQCLAENGDILRAMELGEEGDADEPAGKEDKSSKAMLRDMAALLDASGKRQNEAYQQGAKAASQSSDKLVELVEVLTGHLAIAITNVNNLSVNLSHALQATGTAPEGEESQSSKMLQGLMAMLTQGAVARPAAPEPTNGKPKKP
jgi:hypothetical protein